MDVILWVLQIILCIKFASTAYSHGLQPNNANMAQAIMKLGNNGFPLHKIIAAILLLCSIGVLVPAIIKLDNLFTVLSGFILAFMMMLSIVFHIRTREKPIIIADIVLMLLSAFVAYGRWALSPL